MTRPQRKARHHLTQGFQRSQVTFHDAQELLPAPSCEKSAFRRTELSVWQVPVNQGLPKPAGGGSLGSRGASPGSSPSGGKAAPAEAAWPQGDVSEHMHSPGWVGTGLCQFPGRNRTAPARGQLARVSATAQKQHGSLCQPQISSWGLSGGTGKVCSFVCWRNCTLGGFSAHFQSPGEAGAAHISHCLAGREASCKHNSEARQGAFPPPGAWFWSQVEVTLTSSTDRMSRLTRRLTDWTVTTPWQPAQAWGPPTPCQAPKEPTGRREKSKEKVTHCSLDTYLVISGFVVGTLLLTVAGNVSLCLSLLWGNEFSIHTALRILRVKGFISSWRGGGGNTECLRFQKLV